MKRLEDKWMSGMSGHFNAAAEERKPLMISFDDDDNLVDTTVEVLQSLQMDLMEGGDTVGVSGSRNRVLCI